jgi:alpha-mannosidase
MASQQQVQRAHWVGAGVGVRGDDDKRTAANQLQWITLERLDKFSSNLYWQECNMARSKELCAVFQLGGQVSQPQGVDLLVRVPPDVDSKSIISCEIAQDADAKVSLYASPSELKTLDSWKPCAIGDSFGPSWSTHWFRVVIRIPPCADGRECHLVWDSDSEAAIYMTDSSGTDPDGDPVLVQGLTGGDGCDRRALYRLSHCAKAGEQFTLLVEMACNGMFGNATTGMIDPPNPDRKFCLKQVALAIYDSEYASMYWDMRVVGDMAIQLPSESDRRLRALRAVNEFMNVVDLKDRSTWATARAILQKFLSVPAYSDAQLVHAVGHCHIDTAWLWPVAETRRKSARSWSAQVRLMEEHKDYVFCASQAQQFAWLQTDYPHLFQQVRDMAAQKRFHPVGGTWVEMDCNIPNGEAMCRQFLHGQHYFHREFGKWCEIFWLPDTFGYSAQLPQLIKQAGMRYFLTQKLSWNLINTFPHNSFVWEGCDGSTVLTHFPPADTYNCQADVATFSKTANNNKQRAIATDSLCLFGNGDGGGGPLPSMLEQIDRIKSTAGLPRIKYSSPLEFFHRLNEDATALSRWRGELYLEIHRGTYTTQALVKKYNRKLELALRELELLAVLAQLNSPNDTTAYPTSELCEMWELLLTNQFHDILPGSCIAQVSYDAIAAYRTIDAKYKQLKQNTLQLLGGTKPDSNDAGQSLSCLWNPLCVPQTTIVPGYDEWQEHKSYTANETQLVHVPPLSLCDSKRSCLVDSLFDAPLVEQNDDKYIVIRNQFVRMRICNDTAAAAASSSKCGAIESLVLLDSEHEFVKPGTTINNTVMYEDMPLFWDAWDVMIYSNQKSWHKSAAKAGKILRADQYAVCVEFAVPLSSQSTLYQRLVMYAHTPRIDFVCRCEWNEQHRLLRVEFPLDLQCYRATYETQFGYVERSTHNNTSQDLAQFEVCAHRFADVSESSHGIALLNDCKYGYSCKDGVLSMSLLRAPTRPDAACDVETSPHTFRYALLPHVGAMSALVVREALAFNAPVQQLVLGDTWSSHTAPELQLAHIVPDDASVVLETVKFAHGETEKQCRTLIIRLYEAVGGSHHVCVTLGNGITNLKSNCRWKVDSVKHVDILEREYDAGTACHIETDSDMNNIKLKIRAFQVITLAVTLSELE